MVRACVRCFFPYPTSFFKRSNIVPSNLSHSVAGARSCAAAVCRLQEWPRIDFYALCVTVRKRCVIVLLRFDELVLTNNNNECTGSGSGSVFFLICRMAYCSDDDDDGSVKPIEREVERETEREKHRATVVFGMGKKEKQTQQSNACAENGPNWKFNFAATWQSFVALDSVRNCFCFFFRFVCVLFVRELASAFWPGNRWKDIIFRCACVRTAAICTGFCPANTWINVRYCDI